MSIKQGPLGLVVSSPLGLVVSRPRVTGYQQSSEKSVHADTRPLGYTYRNCLAKKTAVGSRNCGEHETSRREPVQGGAR
eukprot:6733899-Prymnesium_polylepis.1